MTRTLYGITWAAFQYWWMIIPVVLLILILLYKVLFTKKMIKILAPKNRRDLLPNFSWLKIIMRSLLVTAGLLSLYIALLQPQWGTNSQIIEQKGRDLFIALDVSRSMLATDCTPHRIVCAKNKINNLTKKLKSERIGLLLFSGSAFVHCPLTTDYGAFAMFLDSVDVETISSGSTMIEKAITTVLDVYRSMTSKKHKLLIILTDGEDFSSHLDAVKQQAQQEGLHIFALGVGTAQGAPIPLYNQQGNLIGHQKDKHGKVVVSHLDEQLLQQLVNQVGGEYLQMTADDSDINAIVKAVEGFEKEHFEDTPTNQMIDRYVWFTIASFVCFILEWLL